MKKIQFHSLVFACLLLFVSCTQKKQERKEEIVKTDTAVSINPCSEIVYEILTTSKNYKNVTDGLRERVLKKGGTSFGLVCEGSPTPKSDGAARYSKTYDYSVYEYYPDDSVIIARYIFDPVKKQLFDNEPVMHDIFPIAFNKDLLLKLDKSCLEN
jgi:hypothetical protein